jgi:hypothetical protein
LQRYTLGQLMCEVASTATELRAGCAELSEAAAALRVACGEDSDLARGAEELLAHQESRLVQS